jgi:hypothetical protein
MRWLEREIAEECKKELTLLSNSNVWPNNAKKVLEDVKRKLQDSL